MPFEFPPSYRSEARPLDEDALIEAQAVQTTGLACWSWNLGSTRLAGNRAFWRMLDLPESSRRRPLADVLDLLHEGDKKRVERFVLKLFEEPGNPLLLEFEHALLTPRDRGVWLHTQASALRGPDGKPQSLAGFCIDVTKRVRQANRMRADHNRLIDLVDRLPAFVCLIAPDYSIRFANRAFIQHFGEPGARPCYEMIAKRAEPCEICPSFEVFDSKSLNIWELDLPEQSRSFQMYSYPFSDVDGAPLALSLGLDITKQKRVQQALTVSEERYRRITENLAMGIVLLDADLRVVAVNPRLREWFPHVDAEAQPSLTDALPWIEEAHDRETGEREPPWVQAQRFGQTREVLYPGPTPESFFRLLFCPVLSQDAHAASLIAIIEDVSERLRIDAQLERARKLEALGTLAAGVAHEINQPLNALQLYASGLEMLLEKNIAPDRAVLLARLGLILREAGAIREIISHMRALVRQEDGAKAGSADLGQAVERAMSLISAQLRAHGVRIQVQLPENLPRVRANAVQLEQVVINLIVNSMQALDLLSRPDKRIVVMGQRQSERVLLSVADNGTGLQGDARRVFDPFYTTKEVGQGMGLGLSIVHTFVQAWGGEVHAANNDQGGATFSLSLAFGDEAAGASTCAS